MRKICDVLLLDKIYTVHRILSIHSKITNKTISVILTIPCLQYARIHRAHMNSSSIALLYIMLFIVAHIDQTTD